MCESTDYLKYYDDENYLLGEVKVRFRATGEIDPADFYTILIWKANRAKNRHRDRLKRIGECSFANAVPKIASSLYASADRKERLRILMKEWQFALPTATAILTVLYPEEYTVYDYRVRDELEVKDLSGWSFSESLWKDYEQFLENVKRNTPAELSLRDKDRFLIGHSTRKDIEWNCGE